MDEKQTNNKDLSQTPLQSTSIPNVEPTTDQTSPPLAAQPKAPKSSKKKMLAGFLSVFILIVLIAGTGFGGYLYAKSNGDKTELELRDEIAALQTVFHELPADAILASDCIPNMGYHYLTKESDIEFGPFLLVNKKDQVIGVEYMTADSMFTAIPETNPAVEVILKDSSMYGWTYDHAEFSNLPDGHEGLEENHADIHLYTVPPEVQAQACVE